MATTSRKIYELFVSKVPWTIAGKQLREYFGQFGEITKCVIPFDKETGFHRGYGWVAFSSEEGLQNALLKDHHIVEGSKLQIQRNRQPPYGKTLDKETEDS